MCVIAQESNEVNLHELQQEGPQNRTWAAKLGNNLLSNPQSYFYSPLVDLFHLLSLTPITYKMLKRKGDCTSFIAEKVRWELPL